MKINIGISSRHIHLSKKDLNELFGDNYELNKLKNLTQDNNYSCKETVDIINGDKIIKNVRVVGPLREKTQLEISKTDSYFLEINPPIVNSGELENAEIIRIRGPKSEIEKKCAIIQNRHIHINESFAKDNNYKNNDIVKVKLSGIKGGIIDNVYIKITEGTMPELHLDLDDSNAHLISQNSMAEILED